LEAGRKVNVTEPTKIAAEKFGGEKITQIAAAEYTGFAVTESGKLYAWGDTEYGQLCDGETDANSDPVTAPKQTLLTGVKKVSAESTTAMALTTTGEAYVWGNNLFGQFGCGRLDVTEGNKWSNSPVKIEKVYGVTGQEESVEIVDIACGGIANFLLSKDGGVYACGSGGAGELGFLATDSPFEEEGKVLAPTKVAFYKPISIEALAFSGQNTDGTPVDKSVEETVKIVEFCGTIGERTFVKDEDGNVWAWGKNTDGMVGSGNVSTTGVPVLATLFRDKDYDVNIKEKNYLIEPPVGLSIIFGGAALFFIGTEIKWARQRKLEKSKK
jgi:alpha-tubulin suppressor-like RCC1 family protein